MCQRMFRRGHACAAALLLLAPACHSKRADPTPTASTEAPDGAPPPPPATSPPRLALATAGIDRLRIESRDRQPIRVEKQNGVWIVVSPAPKGPASALVIEGLLEDLDKTEFIASTADPKRADLSIRIVAERAEAVVLDAWIGAKVRTENESRNQVLQIEGSPDIWFVRGIPPWVHFTAEAELRASPLPPPPR